MSQACTEMVTENWFSQPFTKRIATGKLVCCGGILNCMEKERLKHCLENLERDGQGINIFTTDR